MRISIACCTYNGAQYILEQLESFEQQTRLPDELIICDDNSSDNTLEIVKAFAQTAPFDVRIYSNNFRPLGSTKNFEKAISLCNGDIIALSDQDDVWLTNKLERFEAVFIKGAGLVFSDGYIVNADLKDEGYTLFDTLDLSRSELKLLQQKKFKEVMIKRNLVTGAACAFRSQHKSLILPISDNWVHDGWIALLISIIDNIVVIDQPLFQYRQHGRNQIGAGRLSLQDKLRKIKKLGGKHYQTQLQGFIDLRQRVLLTQASSDSNELIKVLDGKIEHLYTRSQIVRGRVINLVSLSAALFKGHYHAFARGYISYFRDVFMLFLCLTEKWWDYVTQANRKS